VRMRRVLRPRVLVSAACAFSLMRCADPACRVMVSCWFSACEMWHV
jgi:hypothetical protein